MSLSRRDMALRRRGITASEIAALTGVSQWATPSQLYLSKVFGPSEDEATVAMELGLELEAPVCRIYAQRTGLYLRPCATLQSREHSFALATPDRCAWVEAAGAGEGEVLDVAELAGASTNIEAKSTEWPASKEWGTPGTGEVPARYRAQANWQMGVTGLRVTDLPVLFGKRSVEIYTVLFDEELWLAQLEVAERFLVDHVWARRPPEPDATDLYGEVMRRVWPEATGVVLEVDEGSDVEALVYQYGQLSAATKQLERHKKLTRNALQRAIGEALGVSTRFGVMKWHRHDASQKPAWEPIARELELLCGLALGRLNQLASSDEERAQLEQLTARLHTVRERHTKKGNPYNQLRPTWREAPSAELELRGVVLPQLEAAADESTNQENERE